MLIRIGGTPGLRSYIGSIKYLLLFIGKISVKMVRFTPIRIFDHHTDLRVYGFCRLHYKILRNILHKILTEAYPVPVALHLYTALTGTVGEVKIIQYHFIKQLSRVFRYIFYPLTHNRIRVTESIEYPSLTGFRTLKIIYCGGDTAGNLNSFAFKKVFDPSYLFTVNIDPTLICSHTASVGFQIDLIKTYIFLEEIIFFRQFLFGKGIRNLCRDINHCLKIPVMSPVLSHMCLLLRCLLPLWLIV